jgi:hypothetical protein
MARIKITLALSLLSTTLLATIPVHATTYLDPVTNRYTIHVPGVIAHYQGVDYGPVEIYGPKLVKSRVWGLHFAQNNWRTSTYSVFASISSVSEAQEINGDNYRVASADDTGLYLRHHNGAYVEVGAPWGPGKCWVSAGGIKGRIVFQIFLTNQGGGSCDQAVSRTHQVFNALLRVLGTDPRAVGLAFPAHIDA